MWMVAEAEGQLLSLHDETVHFNTCKNRVFFICNAASMVKHPSSDVKEEIKLHNASSCWPEKTCHFSSTARSISPPAGIQSPSKPLSAVPLLLCSTLFIRFTTLFASQVRLKCTTFAIMQCIPALWNLIMSRLIHILKVWSSKQWYYNNNNSNNSNTTTTTTATLWLASVVTLASTILHRNKLLSIFKQSHSRLCFLIAGPKCMLCSHARWLILTRVPTKST